MGTNSHVLLYGQWTKVHWTCYSERGRNHSRSHILPSLDILSRSRDIRDQTRKLCKIALDFACFWPQTFLGEAPQILDLHNKIDADTDHVAKFRCDRPRELRDPMANLKKPRLKHKAFRNYRSGSGQPN